MLQSIQRDSATYPRGRRRKSLLSGPPRNLAVEILLLQFLSLVCGLLALSLPWYAGYVDEAEAKAVVAAQTARAQSVAVARPKSCPRRWRRQPTRH